MVKYDATKYGNFMYKLCDKGAKFLYKHHWLYYILNLTWGIIMTIIGLLVSLVLLICGKKPHKYHGSWYFEIGQYWGGLELGMNFVCSKDCYDSLWYHELGHTYQNAILGPLFPFLVGIPSAIRYWYREYRYHVHKSAGLKPYDAIWFENSATNIGHQVTKDLYK